MKPRRQHAPRVVDGGEPLEPATEIDGQRRRPPHGLHQRRAAKSRRVASPHATRATSGRVRCEQRSSRRSVRGRGSGDHGRREHGESARDERRTFPILSCSSRREVGKLHTDARSPRPHGTPGDAALLRVARAALLALPRRRGRGEEGAVTWLCVRDAHAGRLARVAPGARRPRALRHGVVPALPRARADVRGALRRLPQRGGRGARDRRWDEARGARRLAGRLRLPAPQVVPAARALGRQGRDLPGRAR